ncbi:progranulin-like [Colossoma macropomum]|uniref:progranulin-like n=1 Tax=Colossoma macropomum TaxID=42526 RepID=UPI00186430FD|nr:progranulin-like [Colossoma macropomum]XP_036440457.1 progranulin-like [Colossoma macropomum]XP_036440458.1 progranulin-like [Colossoma macropomum]
MAAVLVLLMAVLVSGDVTCPDGGNCTDGETCCKQESGYSCCAYPNAVCCPGETHCCPEGFRCNAQNDSCERVAPADGAELQTSKAVFSPGQYCPDGTFCSAGMECCQIGVPWTCCFKTFAAMRPLQPRPATGGDVVSHMPPYLCPNGRVCNFGSHCCFSDQGWSCCFTHVPVEEHEKPHSVSLSGGSQNISMYCPDGSTCPPGKKCCMTESGWHCCKIPDPHPSIPAESLKPAVSVVTCNAHKSCLSGQTCCRGFFRKWSCCPFPKGECCRGRSSCCNHGAGWSCGPKGTCVWGGLITPRKRTLPEQ